ncbi:hypothetical protein SSX86_004319 [Deinandra increscens subsp. villosa]|uniref:DNA/RNA-binding protein Alba-like domain-containing protein n=1 Tax=Deinandra increscens subsp. villosa TaxID=3103831 RepID=A0AAP0H7I6_9ASTR
MDRYTKVEQKKPDIPINENEIRITSQGLVRNYISYATTLLQERREKEIVLKAMGQAVSKTAEVISCLNFKQRNIPRLHQDTNITSISITDVWEPIEEGLLPVEMTRQVSMISITLSTKELNKDSPGYQAPVYVERPRPHYNNYQRHQQPQQAYNVVNEEPYGGSYHGNKGRGQGNGLRGGRGRGWNRGGYGNQGGGYGSYQGGDGYRNYQGGGYGSYQGGDGYRNYQGGGYGSYQGGDGHRNYQGGGGYGNYQGGGGYGNYQGSRGYGNYRGGRGYSNYQGGGGDYGNYQGDGEYGNYQDKNGYSKNNQGGGRWGNGGYYGGGYMRGGGGRGGGGGRFNGRGRGRMGGRPRDGGDPQK